MSATDLQKMNYQGLTFMLFPPSMLALYADVTGGSTVRPHNVTDAKDATGADAVLDGPMFTKCNPSGTYASQQCGYVKYAHYDLSNGINIPSTDPNQGVTISVLTDGSTQAAVGGNVPPNASVAVQLYPELVANGVPSQVSDMDSSARAALAIMGDGRMAFVVSQPMSMPQFAQRLAAAGVLYAGYTDGGGSASLGASDGTYTGSSEHRRVLTWLLARARQSTGTAISTLKSTITQSPGTSAAVAAVVLLSGVGAIWWWSRRRR